MRLVSMSFSVETLHFFGRVAGAADASSPHIVEHASRFAFAAAVAHAVGSLVRITTKAPGYNGIMAPGIPE
jgi:hypothetical protein